jgi:hypothetical protein
MMFLILSGEGETDIGTNDKEFGPMTKLIDNWIAHKIGYSFIKEETYTIISKTELTKETKSIKAQSRKGVNADYETTEFFKRARALSIIAHRKKKDLSNETPLIVILFVDSDGRSSSKKNKWAIRSKSILDGFNREKLATGVPMIPIPISEAWILCALKNNYKHCAKLEDESGSKKSPKSLKKQLEDHLREPETRILLNNKIDDGEIDIDRIDMDSMNEFKQRLNEVLDGLLPSYEKRSIIDRRPNN